MWDIVYIALYLITTSPPAQLGGTLSRLGRFTKRYSASHGVCASRTEPANADFLQRLKLNSIYMTFLAFPGIQSGQQHVCVCGGHQRVQRGIVGGVGPDMGRDGNSDDDKNNVFRVAASFIVR